MTIKTIGAYDKYTQIFVVGGLLIMHLLVFGLCTFFIYQFLIISADYSALLLIGMLLTLLIVADVLGHKNNTFRRFLLHYRVSPSGIEAYGIGWKRWTIPWESIRIYGLTRTGTEMLLLFFSSNANEKCARDSVAQMNTQKVVLQFRRKAWKVLLEYMPQDMTRKLEPAIKEEREIFLKR